MAIFTFLLIGWMLTWFHLDELFIQAFKELFKKEVSNATYYLLFLAVGIFGEIVLLIQGFYYNYFLH